MNEFMNEELTTSDTIDIISAISIFGFLLVMIAIAWVLKQIFVKPLMWLF